MPPNGSGNQALIARLRTLLDSTLLPLATSLGTTPASLRAGLGAAALVLAVHAALGRGGARVVGGVGAAGEGPGAAAGGGDVSRGGDAAAQQPGGRTQGSAGGGGGGRKGGGLLRVSIATPGLVVRSAAEGGASVDMSVGAPGLDEAGAQAVARLVASGCDVYLITQQAAAEAATPEAGTQGPGVAAAVEACLPVEQRHRSLVCSTMTGRIALVRQLGADIHLDACADVAAELGRLRVPCLHVAAGGAGLGAWVDAQLEFKA